MTSQNIGHECRHIDARELSCAYSGSRWTAWICLLLEYSATDHFIHEAYLRIVFFGHQPVVLVLVLLGMEVAKEHRPLEQVLRSRLELRLERRLVQLRVSMRARIGSMSSALRVPISARRGTDR